MKKFFGCFLIVHLLALVACTPPQTDTPDVVESVDAGVEECPTEAVFTVLTGSVNNFGWTGANHGRTLPVDAQFRAAISECDDECENCRFEGPLMDPEVDLSRCLIDTSIGCTVDEECPFDQCTGEPGAMSCTNDRSISCESDEDCGHSLCRVLIGPLSASPVSVSSIANAFATADGFAGRIDRATGAVSFSRFEVMITAAVGTREGSGYPQTCEGDDTRNDGIKNGRCTPSTYGPAAPVEDGRPCDAQGGAGWVRTRPGIYSSDCSQSQRTALVLPTRQLSTTNSISWTLDPADQPECSDGTCWCGYCDDTEEPCHSQSDCNGSQCLGIDIIGETDPQNNACVTPCVWNQEALEGTCERAQTPDEDGNPRPNRPSLCFPAGDDAEMIVRGSTRRLDDNHYSIEVGSLGCTGRSASGPVVNARIGLPGPQLIRLRFLVELN